MENRKRLIKDLQELRDDNKYNFGIRSDEVMRTLNAAIYELECSGYPADGVWYIEKRGSSASLILKPEEVEKVDVPTMAILESRREAAHEALREIETPLSIWDVVSAVFKAIAKK